MVSIYREIIIPNIWCNEISDEIEMMLWFWIQVNHFQKVSFLKQYCSIEMLNKSDSLKIVNLYRSEC